MQNNLKSIHQLEYHLEIPLTFIEIFASESNHREINQMFRN